MVAPLGLGDDRCPAILRFVRPLATRTSTLGGVRRAHRGRSVFGLVLCSGSLGDLYHALRVVITPRPRIERVVKRDRAAKAT